MCSGHVKGGINSMSKTFCKQNAFTGWVVVRNSVFWERFV